MSIIKTCSRCGINYDESNFYKNKRLPDGLDYYCKNCRKRQVTINQKVNHKIIRKSQERVNDLRESLKTPCAKCGEERKYLIQFHHIDPREKKFMVSSYNLRSNEAIRQEAAKCICLCSNCHDEFHYIYGKQPTDPVKSLQEYLL